jgi:hypothetical protein
MVMPVWRMVATVDAATPYNLFPTELIIALVLGEVKSPKPKPRSACPPMIISIT